MSQWLTTRGSLFMTLLFSPASAFPRLVDHDHAHPTKLAAITNLDDLGLDYLQ